MASVQSFELRPQHSRDGSRDSGIFHTTKGLWNAPGLNNCFLNSAVQIFNICVSFIKLLVLLSVVFNPVLIKVDNSIFTVPWIVEVIHDNFVLCLPAILMEKALNTYEEIKIFVAKELLFCSDNTLRKALYELLELMDTVPCEYSIWTNFMLNGKFSFSFLFLCLTYFISMLQFYF